MTVVCVCVCIFAALLSSFYSLVGFLILVLNYGKIERCPASSGDLQAGVQGRSTQHCVPSGVPRSDGELGATASRGAKEYGLRSPSDPVTVIFTGTVLGFVLVSV